MTTYKEIYTIPQIVDELKTMETPYKVFAYYMFRSSLPFNRINRDQNHRHTNEIIQLFEFLYKNKNEIDNDLLVHDIETYLVYLWTNHGFYFCKENSNSKRTPQRIGLNLLTEVNMRQLLNKFRCLDKYAYLLPFIFDAGVDPEMIEDTIEKSGNNFYGEGFTEEYYKQLQPDEQNRLNAYPTIVDNKIKVRYHSVYDHYAEELTVAVFWLQKAYDYIQKHHEYHKYFDQYMVKSMELLILYYQTGDEKYYKKHTIEWIKTNSKLDYVQGFIENYHDPKLIRGNAGSEVTMKTMDMTKFNAILLDLEKMLPLPNEYKRTDMTGIVMNVSVNKIIFGGGDYGPAVSTAAYCLPNYDDVRSQYGSKQVIYKLPKSLEEQINPTLAKQFKTKARLDFIQQYDQDNQLYEDLWDVQVLLHETLGHASGRFHQHTFKKGENLVIKGTKYNVGDVIDVTDDNYSEFITSDTTSLEELRAEISALYMSIAQMDVLAENGLFKGWYKKIGKDELAKQCIIEMVQHIFRRYYSQGENFTEIKEAHAKANVVIANYLLEAGSIRINEEVKNVDGNEYHLYEVVVVDFDLAVRRIIELLNLVQKIKSTGDGNGCKQLFERYTVFPITMEQANVYRKHLHEIRQRLIGPVKMMALIFPEFIPKVENNVVVDVEIINGGTIVEQHLKYSNMMLSKEY